MFDKQFIAYLTINAIVYLIVCALLGYAPPLIISLLYGLIMGLVYSWIEDVYN